MLSFPESAQVIEPVPILNLWLSRYQSKFRKKFVEVRRPLRISKIGATLLSAAKAVAVLYR